MPKQTVKLNLNDPVRFKLTERGKDIYYHQYDSLNEYLRTHSNSKAIVEPHYPKVDENGYSSMQLWVFMELYGNYIGMCQPNIIEPLEIEFEVEAEESETKRSKKNRGAGKIVQNLSIAEKWLAVPAGRSRIPGRIYIDHKLTEPRDDTDELFIYDKKIIESILDILLGGKALYF